MKKVLFVATVVRLHINMFHKPYLRWFHEQGWQVDVAANNDYEKKEECIIPYCDHFYCLPFERTPVKIGNLKAYWQLKKLLNQEQYDIVHCHTPMGGVITRLAVSNARKHGTRVIYTAHGFHFFKGAPVWNWLVYYPIERILARRTDLLITMNEEDFLRARKFPAKRVEKVHGVGLDLNKFVRTDQKEKAEIRRRLKLETDEIFAISVAQLIKRKNHHVLIQAVAVLQNPKFHLFICGDGIQEKRLKKEVQKAGIEKQVHFLGFREDVYQLCRSADLFLLASRQEGLPVAVMEAMACHLPIIASRIRGNTDLIDEGKGGYLVEAADIYGFAQAIQQTLQNKSKMIEMENHNDAKIQAYGEEKVLKKMADLYQSMMQTEG